ncbi:MAG: hypothetical protein BroJett006_18770 [Betaproteobacteria bacterium]|nr:MAG: hypothetical protein BroJett006_18770 [Betaproteobacteria bacterium]
MHKQGAGVSHGRGTGLRHQTGGLPRSKGGEKGVKIGLARLAWQFPNVDLLDRMANTDAFQLDPR